MIVETEIRISNIQSRSFVCKQGLSNFRTAHNRGFPIGYQCLDIQKHVFLEILSHKQRFGTVMRTRKRGFARSIVGKSRNLGNELRKQGNITLPPRKSRTYLKIIPRLWFARIIREISEEYAANKRRSNAYRWTRTALDAMQTTVEAYLINLFKKVQILSVNANRLTVKPKDLEIILMLRDEISLPGERAVGRKMSPKRRRSRGRSPRRSASRKSSTKRKSPARKRTTKRSKTRRKRPATNRRKNLKRANRFEQGSSADADDESD